MVIFIVIYIFGIYVFLWPSIVKNLEIESLTKHQEVIINPVSNKGLRTRALRSPARLQQGRLRFDWWRAWTPKLSTNHSVVLYVQAHHQSKYKVDPDVAWEYQRSVLALYPLSETGSIITCCCWVNDKISILMAISLYVKGNFTTLILPNCSGVNYRSDWWRVTFHRSQR